MPESGRKSHWENVHASKAETEVSWHQNEPRLSLELIREFLPVEHGRVIDVGGGASRLVDGLLGLNLDRLAVLDIAGAALAKAKARLGEKAKMIEWMITDLVEARDLGEFDIWHDRAVFHFLTDAADRRKYVELAERTIPAGGHLVIATFADDGPLQCSGLNVQRYNADAMTAELGPGFALVKETREAHATPWGSSQSFFYGAFRRR